MTITHSPQTLVTKAPISWKKRILYTLERVMYWTGMGFAYVKYKQIKGVTILMYHSVASPESAQWIDPNVHITPELFDTHMNFLAQNRHVISVSELMMQLGRGETPPAGTVAITFDDGYIDNMTVAAPILEKYGLPAMWYIPTGMVNRGENPWIDRMYTAFKTRRQNKLSLEGIGKWDLGDIDQLFSAYNKLREKMLSASFEERESIIAHLIEQIQPTKTPPRLILSWDELKEVEKKYPHIEIGLHSHNHIDYSNDDQKVVEMDLKQSLTDFNRELERPPAHFAFPYNRHSDESRAMLLESGLHSAMGQNNETLITTNTDYFALPRIDPPCSMTLLRFYTSGAFPGLPNTILNRK